jgi:3-hydroxyisobutyrate dehydrogenase-like beta-hydroxyacid dehydrogenase
MAVTVGFIGVGNMGNPMAGNVLKQSFPMTVFDLNPKAMENLIAAGAKRAGSPQEVVDNAEIVLTSLPASPPSSRYTTPTGATNRQAGV